MYGTFHQERFRDIIDGICEKLGATTGICITKHPTAINTTESMDALRVSQMRSSASTPSLRCRDGSLPPHMKMDAGGNVRVVVRVRAFLPRGMWSVFKFKARSGWIRVAM
jgi:hypothetical protein